MIVFGAETLERRAPAAPRHRDRPQGRTVFEYALAQWRRERGIVARQDAAQGSLFE